MNQKDLTLDDWRLIQDCVVEQIFNVKNRQSYGHEDVVDQLEILLEKIRVKGLTPRI